MKRRTALACALLAPALIASPHHPFELDGVNVRSRGTPLVGEAITASQGIIGQVDLETRPMLRTGEILEAVPGMIVTQHSGSGKANQYFLRGFNLDHGTDFATWIDGMPVNMVSYGHGQGYTDLNFIIPELVETISYLKGPYYAKVGDFSSAGSAIITTADQLARGMVTAEIGEGNYYRGLVASSNEIGNGDLLFGIEDASNDGPWTVDEDLKKINGLIKYSAPASDQSKYSIAFMGYDSSWNSADQMPERAVEMGLISPFGSIDPTVGGKSSRYSLSGDWSLNGAGSYTTASAYSIYYDMNLWSNFTYFLDNPVDGDQFQQTDRRMIYGAALTHVREHAHFLGRHLQQTFGLQTRFDDIDRVGLYHTSARQRLDTYREDTVRERSMSAFYDASLNWTETFKTNFGARFDYYDFNVESDLPGNSGDSSDSLLSPKFNAVYTPSRDTELYLSAGYGFHSNDARGSTLAVDPNDGVTPAGPVDPLVKSLGYEIGARHHWTERSNTSVALWSLELDSELLYVGDAGNTEASLPSERYGLEIANYLVLGKAFSAEVDIAFTVARFSDASPEGDKIPGSIESVSSLGLNYGRPESPWFGSIRYRYFSERPLIEDNSVRADSFDSVNLKIGYKTEGWRVSLDILNALDSDDHDITYFYASRLPGEPEEGREDRHYHIIQPRAFRLNVSKFF